MSPPSFAHHPYSEKIYNYFEEKYCLGKLGLWESIICASAYTKTKMNLLLSSLIIAPAGFFKSSVMRDIHKMFKSKTYYMPDQPTDRGLIRLCEDRKKEINGKIFLLEDSISAFPTLEDNRQERLLMFFVKVLMGEKYEFSDFEKTKGTKVKIGLLANVATSNFETIYKILATTTFLDRVIPFNYMIDPHEEYKVFKRFRSEIESGIPPKIKLKTTQVKPVDICHEKLDQINFAIQQNTGLSASRADNHLILALKSLAVLEGRDEVTEHDIDFFAETFLKHINSSKCLSPYMFATFSYLLENRKADKESLKSYLLEPTTKAFFNLPEREITDMEIDILYYRCKKMIEEDKRRFNLIKSYEEKLLGR